MEYFGDIQSKRNVIICAANYNKLTSRFSRLKVGKKVGGGGEREGEIAISTTTEVTPEFLIYQTL